MLTLVALVLVQARVAVPPLVIVDGVAVRVTVGGGGTCGGVGGGAVTVTVTEEEALPPAPMAVIL
jgi:hypothetical protein